MLFAAADAPVPCPGLFDHVTVEGHGWCGKRLHPRSGLNEQTQEKEVSG